VCAQQYARIDMAALRVRLVGALEGGLAPQQLVEE